MARFFNVNEKQYILIAHFGFPTIQWSDYYLKCTPDFKRKKVEKILVYSDIVSPTIRVGGHLTNLLDIISVPNSNTIHRPMASGIYKPVKNHTLNLVSMIASGVDGEDLYFEKDAHAAYELHIRPVETK